jgi:hypothetical protein
LALRYLETEPAPQQAKFNDRWTMQLLPIKRLGLQLNALGTDNEFGVTVKNTTEPALRDDFIEQ